MHSFQKCQLRARSNGRTARILATWVAILIAYAQAHAGGFTILMAGPSMDRWMYPFNATPGTRPVAPVFGTFGDAAGVDTRHGQFLVGFDLAGVVPTGSGPGRYLIRRARFKATISQDRAFQHDPTQDDYRTYLSADHPDYKEDADPGRPIELFGAAFRNDYTQDSFLEDSPFGASSSGGRNAFAAGYDANGVLEDVGNNVGKTNTPSFEVFPFAIGRVPGLPAGEPVPAGSRVEFEFNLGNPLVLEYLQAALHTGRLRLTVSSLHTGSFGGGPTWPEFHTRDSILGDPPALELEGTWIGEADTDVDGLTDDWETHFFAGLSQSSDADPDGDGASNKDELRAGTDPTEARSVLRLHLARQTSGSRWILRFPFEPSRSYKVLVSRGLTAGSIVTHALMRRDQRRGEIEFQWEETGAEPVAGWFFRVGVE